MLRLFFLLMGVAFGYVLILSGVSNYDVICDMFLFKSFHMYGLLGITVVLSFLVVQILKKLRWHAVLTGEAVEFEREKPTRAHWIGGLLSGLGWGLTGACPGPAIAQIGFGTLAGLFTASGILLGVYLYGSRQSK